MNDGDLIAFGEAARRLGSSQATLRKAVKAGVLPVYLRPLDRRLRLVRRQDVDALAAVRRLEPREVRPMAG